MVFHQVVPPSGIQQPVEASLEGVAVAKGEHLSLDSEGGAQVTTPRTRYLTTAISVALASSSMADHDRDAGIGADGGGAGQGAANGASGFGFEARSLEPLRFAHRLFGFWFLWRGYVNLLPLPGSRPGCELSERHVNADRAPNSRARSSEIRAALKHIRTFHRNSIYNREIVWLYLTTAAVAAASAAATSPWRRPGNGSATPSPGWPRSRLAITYDDGPNEPHTQHLLDVLARHQVRATFFLIGRYVQQRPDVVRELIKAGHVVGNHTFTHPLLIFKSARRSQGAARKLQSRFDRRRGRTLQSLPAPFRWPAACSIAHGAADGPRTRHVERDRL